MPVAKVSIITPCFQQGELLGEAIESVLRQTNREFEMIVVNDGSTDSTAQVAAKWSKQDGRIRYVEQANAGQAVARARGLRDAEGEFLVFLDADDLLEPTMLAECALVLERHPETALVVANAVMVDKNGKTALRTFEQARVVDWPAILEGNPYGALAGAMARREAVEAVGGLEFPATPGAEDWDLWVRLARCGMGAKALKKCLARYRQTAGGWSRRLLPMLQSQIAVLNWAHAVDARLERSTLSAKRPISKGEHARLVNGRVFHSLGLAAFEEIAEWDLEQIASHLLPGKPNTAYWREQFLWGCQTSIARTGSRTHSEKIVAVMRTALGNAGLERYAPGITAAMESILKNPRQLAPLVRRVKRRVRDLF